MATPIINIFQQFQLSESEQPAGHTLNSLQLMTLQNLRADYAIKKINLVYTPDNPQLFLQQEAEISGWLGCLNYIIDCHDSATSTIIDVNSSNEPESGTDAYSQFS